MKNKQVFEFNKEFSSLIKKRERIYSSPKETGRSEGAEEKYLIFSCNSIIMGAKLKTIEAIYNFERVNPAPLVPKHILGLFNHRGLVSPVIDLHRLIKGETSSYNYLLVLKGPDNALISLAITDLVELASIHAAAVHGVGINTHDYIKRLAAGELSDGTLILNTDLGGIL